MSNSGNPLITPDEILSHLESGNYLKNKNINHNKKKLVEFSNWFNSCFRPSSLHCDDSEKEELVYLLLCLKKNIKWCISELGRSISNKEQSFVCIVCNETINRRANHNFWDELQDHEHFEESYHHFLTGSIPESTIESFDVESNNPSESIEEINDNELDIEIAAMEQLTVTPVAETQPEPVQNETNNGETSSSSGKESPLNAFRFNFVVQYDNLIESTLYPESIINAVRRIDRITDHTMQRAGRNRAVCLLCPCEIGKAKVSKFVVTNHAMGQRHLRFAANKANVNALKTYHESFHNMEPEYQAHQVYFMPEIGSNTRCIICKKFENYSNLKSHIESDGHKKKVLDMFEKKSTIYHLMNLQVQVYGIMEVPEVEEAPQTNGQKHNNAAPTAIVKNGTKPKNGPKSDSDSSPTSETQEVIEHIIEKAVPNKNSKEVLDLLPNRYREHLKFLKKNGNYIRCTACKENILQEVDMLKSHIKLPKHLELTKIKVQRYDYYCEICNMKFTDEFSWNGHFTQGPNKHINIAESRKKKVEEYECSVCCTVIFGDELSLFRHRSRSGRKNINKKKEIKLPNEVKKMFHDKNSIDTEGKRMTQEANNVLQCRQITEHCCKDIESALIDVFGVCKAYPFGSRISGLGNHRSDLDVFIDVGGMYNGYKNQDPQSQVMYVKTAVKIFNKRRDHFSDVSGVPSARTPIVRLFHRPTELDCDLSFRHGLSVENTKFLRFCMDLQPITQPFILILKKWSDHCQLHEHITTYALAIMAIFFLQLNSYLLSIKQLRKVNPQKPLVIDGWETLVYSTPLDRIKQLVPQCEKDLKTLLRDFFHYYATFNYETDVVCPLLGCTIPKTLFYDDSNGSNLPPEMISYVNKLQNDDPEQFRALSPLCIQDPFDLSHNLTKACQQGTVNKLKQYCKLSYEHLDHALGVD